MKNRQLIFSENNLGGNKKLEPLNLNQTSILGSRKNTIEDLVDPSQLHNKAASPPENQIKKSPVKQTHSAHKSMTALTAEPVSTGVGLSDFNLIDTATFASSFQEDEEEGTLPNKSSATENEESMSSQAINIQDVVMELEVATFLSFRSKRDLLRDLCWSIRRCLMIWMKPSFRMKI